MERIHQQIRDNFEKAFFDLLKQKVAVYCGTLNTLERSSFKISKEKHLVTENYGLLLLL